MFKNNFKRLVAVGVIAGLAVTAGPITSAHAAEQPTPPTTTDAPLWILDTNNGLNKPEAQYPWYFSDVVGSPISVTSEDQWGEDFANVLFPDVAGAYATYTFISEPGQERTRANWKAYGDPWIIGVGGDQLLMPNVGPGEIIYGQNAQIRDSGGTFSLGIAYVDLLGSVPGNNVLKAIYTTINVDPGGNYRFAQPGVEAPPVVEKATTTTLTASAPSVEAGSQVTLTANVSTADSTTVTGNVQFFAGTTLLGSVGLANGQATRTVTVPSVGDHTYTAKFVENTVGSDKFLASTSDEVAVTGTEPAVPVVPNAPTESALNEGTANGATASIDGNTATLNVDAELNGQTVNVFAYSTPTFLGEKTVADGKITVDASVLDAGEHKLAIVDPTNGDVLAWAAFTKTTEAVDPSFSKQINADVAALEPADGEFSLINLSGDTVTLANPAIVNGQSVSSGALGSFKVTDLRQVSKPGWTLGASVAEFTLAGGTDTIESSAFGIDPKVVSQAGTGAAAPTLGSEQVAGSATYPWDFAALDAGSFSGVSTYDADLEFKAPQGKPAGTYQSTLTLTLVSK